MRTFSTSFREALRNVKQISAIVSYQSTDGTYILTTEDEAEFLTEDGVYLLGTETGAIEIESSSLLSVNPVLDTQFLKTTCKGLNVDSKINIPIGTKINCQIGVLVGTEYEYMNYGTYIVTSSTYQADTESYLLECYDLMIYSNISYDDNPLSISFPCTVGNFINAIATKINLTTDLDNTSGVLDETISEDVWTDYGLNYRDILDDLSAITGNLMVDSSNNLVNINPNSSITGEQITDRDMSDTSVDLSKQITINHLKITSDFNTLLDEFTDDTSISTYGEYIFQINDNYLLNAENETFGSYTWDLIDGIQYYVCDINTPGLLIFEAFDQFDIVHNSTTYPTILLQDDTKVTQGLIETIGAEDIESTDTYSVVNKTENKINNAVIEIDKTNAQVVLKADSNGNLVTCTLDADADDGTSFTVVADDIDLSGKTISLTSDSINIESTNFSVDTNGNMTCNDATINGDLVTANGVLTNLIFPAEGWGWQWENAYDGLGANWVGWNVNSDYTDIQQSFLVFSIRIPDNFVVQSAKMILRHSPMTWGSVDGTTTYTGYCRNIKLYSASNLGQSGYGYYMGYAVVGGNTPTFTGPITSDSFTFGTSFSEVESSDFSSVLSSGAGTYNIAVKSSDSISSSSTILNDPAQYLGPYTGCLTGYVEVIGYKSTGE